MAGWGKFERTLESGYTVEYVEPPQTSTAKGWTAADPNGEPLESTAKAGLWPTEDAAWKACDNHRMFGHAWGPIYGNLAAAGYSVWAPRPDATWTAKLNGVAIAESLESEVSAWEMCSDHLKAAQTPSPAVKLATLRTVILSASHISPQTLTLLQEAPQAAWPICGGLFGDNRLMLFCQEDADDEIPPDLLTVTQWAAGLGFDRIELDPEYEPTPGLAVYDHAPRKPVDALEAFAKVRDLFEKTPGWLSHHDDWSAADMLEAIAEAVGAPLNGKPSAPVAPTPWDNIRRYDERLSEWEVCPTGDDFNNVVSMAQGGGYIAPTKGGR